MANKIYSIKGVTLAKHTGDDKHVTVPSYITKIGACAFYHCKSIVSVSLPEGITIIGDWAFNKDDGIVIHAPAESEAERYAEEWGILHRRIKNILSEKGISFIICKRNHNKISVWTYKYNSFFKS